MEAHKKQLLDSFQKYLIDNFKRYCQKHNVKNCNTNFVTFLVDRELFSPATIRRYTILQEFDVLFPLHDFHKGKTIETLADRFSLSTRHIWSLIKYSQRPEQRKKRQREKD